MSIMVIMLILSKDPDNHLPLNTSFFCCVDFGNFWCVAEEVAFDVVKEEVLGVGVGEIQAVVIDDLCLLLQPVAPAWLADLGCDALAKLVGKWGESDSRPLLPAMCAFYVWHLIPPGLYKSYRTYKSYKTYFAALIAAIVSSSFGLNKPSGRTSL
jgi:hypothetical protein